ncbi:VTT domain-containing protein [Prescottella defluvii]|uniref:DedA family protein n=1 Tax=Prescottella defluvii TaxID=1323361 RepID=UPI0018CEFAEE|nr:VTT domain-containing protein [Prescottella defluvii]
MDIAQLQSRAARVADLAAVDHLARLPAGLLLACVAALLVLESGVLVGIVAPGSSIPLTLGILVAVGAVELVESIVVVAVASRAGSQWAFTRARRSGIAVLPRRLESALPERIARWQRRVPAQFGTRPWLAALTGQLIGTVRTLSPRALAMSSMRRREFAVATLVGATLWSGAFVTIGVAGGGNETFRSLYGFAWAPVVLVLVLASLRKHLVSRKILRQDSRSPASLHE